MGQGQGVGPPFRAAPGRPAAAAATTLGGGRARAGHRRLQLLRACQSHLGLAPTSRQLPLWSSADHPLTPRPPPHTPPPQVGQSCEAAKAAVEAELPACARVFAVKEHAMMTLDLMLERVRILCSRETGLVVVSPRRG